MNKKGAQRKVGRKRHTARTALTTAYALMPESFQRHLIINEAMMYSHFEYSESYLERELRQMRQDGEIDYVYDSPNKKFNKIIEDEKKDIKPKGVHKTK